MAQDWDIKPRSGVCHGCGAEFKDQETYHSSLVFGSSGYERGDYCETCWSGQAANVSPYSTWQGIFRAPLPEPEEALKKETAESLLRHLIEGEDPSKKNVMYILGAMLERKRILVERDVQLHDDGTKVIVYEHRKTGETFLVPDPGLHLDQLELVQREVLGLLGANLPERKGLETVGLETEDAAGGGEDRENPTGGDEDEECDDDEDEDEEDEEFDDEEDSEGRLE